MPIRGMEDKREIDKGKLKELAFIDDLTLLYNRRYLYQYLPTELRDIERLGRQLCLFMIDVDTFKEVNDAYGHLCGDKILVEIAEILRKNLREEDTIVRYAGDEFIAILPGAEEKVAINIAERIIQKTSKNPFRVSKGKAPIHLTITMGLAIFPRDAQDPEKLIYQADRALYFSKHSGRNCVYTTKDISAEVLHETEVREILSSPRLIGRKTQMSRLKELLDAAEKGQAKFALIKGERGVGKTRLINEFKKYAQLKGIINISASCSPEISNQPYKVLTMALANLFASLGPDVRKFIRSLPEAQTAQLANYIPTLKQFLPEELKAVEASTEKQAEIDLFKGICQGLIYAVKRNTFLLLIDDFHWVDKGTLQLFNYIIKDLRNIPILIVVAYREGEWEKRREGASLKELLYQIKQTESADELALEPLEKEEILEMITAIFRDLQLHPKFVDIVYDVSAGNPLFIEEILRALVNKDFIFYQDKKWYTKEINEAFFPPFLKEAVQKRITELDEETRPVVLAAAVIGQAFEFDLLCQLLEKDPGYILEIIDRAVKQHIILPESPFQTDRFKFNSGAIWDIIYNNIDAKKKQILHKRLALINEKRYKNNIGTVAGNLGYHFAKSRDTEKANLYTNMLLEKASYMPNYEDVLGFLQEALAERVEETAVPLSDASMKLIPPILRSLRLAAQNIRLYPSQSEISKGFIDQAYKHLSDILAKDGTLILGMAENRILINSEEISEKTSREAGADAVTALMIKHRIKSITFKKGLTKEQLVIFLQGLSQNYDGLISQGGLLGMLRKNGISLIKVSDIRYEQTSKLGKQRTRLEEGMLINYLVDRASVLGGKETKIAHQAINDPEQFAQILKKTAQQASVEKGKDKIQTQANVIVQGLQKLNDQVLSQSKNGIERYRKNIAQTLMALDYKLRSKIIQAPPPLGKTASKDIITDVLKEFSDEKVSEMAVREFSSSDGNLINMRRLLRRFLLDPQRKQKLMPKLKTKLHQLGMNEDEASWVLEEELWQGLSLKEKVERAVRLSPETYMKLEASKQITGLISELLENGRYNELGKIIDKLLRQLEDESTRLRSTTLNDLDKINEILIAKENFFLLEQIINCLIGRLDKEKDPQVYSSITRVLATSCTRLIKKQNFIQATGILREFNLRLGRMSKLLHIQKEAIKDSKVRIIASPQLIDWLIQKLETKIEEHHDFWELSKVIVEIGPMVIEPMFALAVSKDIYSDPFKRYALRWSFAKVLKGMGDEALFYLKDRLRDKNVEQVKVALEFLGHMQNKNVVEYLQALLKHKDLNVRKEAIATLGKVGSNQTIKLLSEYIKDKNNQIRIACIWALENIGSKEVLPILEPLLKEKEISGEVQRIIRRIKRK